MRAKFGLVAALLLLGFVILLTCRRAHGFDTAPDAPATPVGPSSGACDSLYLFTTSAVDPDSDSVAYR
ncbi:hypothetical protein FJY69_08710, partial [candidate division WOR-3 bacterium]|nr:hypothetical protein [candidate division WOR-3 bacterium]